MSSTGLETHMLRLVELARSASLKQIVSIVLTALLVASFLKRDKKKNVANIPIHNASWLEPALVSKSRFVTGARSIISSGYEKVP